VRATGAAHAVPGRAGGDSWAAGRAGVRGGRRAGGAVPVRVSTAAGYAAGFPLPRAATRVVAARGARAVRAGPGGVRAGGAGLRARAEHHSRGREPRVGLRVAWWLWRGAVPVKDGLGTGKARHSPGSAAYGRAPFKYVTKTTETWQILPTPPQERGLYFN